MSQNKKHDAYKETARMEQKPATGKEGEEQRAGGPSEESREQPGEDLAALKAELEQARAEAAENLDKFLRARADLENVRRRADSDVANAHKFAIEKFASELLSVRDSLELARAVEVENPGEAALAKMHEGLDLTLKQLDTVFDKFQLQIIDPVGEKFDPERHQAMSMVESEEVSPNHIVTVIQKGCLLHGRLLRPAMVIVAKARNRTALQGDEAEPADEG